MTQKTDPRFTNRLIEETSPYLLQHAHNPVDWYPWGEEALRRSKEEDKPILLSIGYSACHWCHVMERESFENEEIANLMNEHFICIKVDREERPDLDEIYMTATVAMNQGQGGWPMTVFLTPEQEPFFAGTYFPPVERYGRPGFQTVLLKVAEIWKNNRETLIKQGASLTEHIRQHTGMVSPQSVGIKEVDHAVTQLSREFDPVHGGFGNAPKFPPSAALSLLLRHFRRTGDDFSLKIVKVTLDAMANGGMYDHIGGGFARYSTDQRWLVPHFEKMLYDNALLAKIYLEGFQVTQSTFYRRIAGEILDYILKEMTAPEGGFYSSTDADSEGEEGKFFVWTPQEIKTLLGEEEGNRFCLYYDISDSGNWEGKSIPNRPRTVEQVAEQSGMGPVDLERSIGASRKKIYETRLKRIPPGLDDKILTAWNGLMIGAMAEGARILGNDAYREAAEGAADFILSTLQKPDGRLLRTYRKGKAHLNACLDDYAYFCEGLVDLYEAGGSARYLKEAERLAGAILSEFASKDGGGFYSTSNDHERLIVRHREGHDGATPGPNATAASVLARLSYHFDREEMRQAAISAISAYGKLIAQAPRAFCKTLSVVDFLLEGPIELALIEKKDHPNTGLLREKMNRHYLPNRIVAHRCLPEGSSDRSLPLLEGKDLVRDLPALYICYQFTCQEPITDPERVASEIEAQQKRLRENIRSAL